MACGRDFAIDAELAKVSLGNTRVRQFSTGLIDYVVAACGLPKDLGRVAQSELFSM